MKKEMSKLAVVFLILSVSLLLVPVVSAGFWSDFFDKLFGGETEGTGELYTLTGEDCNKDIKFTSTEVKKHESTPTLPSGSEFRRDATTAEKLCQLMGFSKYTEAVKGRFSSPHDNYVYYWDGSEFKEKGAQADNRWIKSLTCFKECCVPKTCKDLNRECGEWDDGCEGFVNCGSCDDNNVCTTDTCSQGSCQYTQITSCINNDRCCPSDCTTNNDNDCVCILVCQDNECGDDGCGGSCGTCGGNSTCLSGDCVCSLGYADCNDDNSDGCEIDINNDKNNCKSCGNVCEAGQICKDGACVDKPIEILDNYTYASGDYPFLLIEEGQNITFYHRIKIHKEDLDFVLESYLINIKREGEIKSIEVFKEDSQCFSMGYCYVEYSNVVNDLPAGDYEIIGMGDYGRFKILKKGWYNESLVLDEKYGKHTYLGFYDPYSGSIRIVVIYLLNEDMESPPNKIVGLMILNDSETTDREFDNLFNMFFEGLEESEAPMQLINLNGNNIYLLHFSEEYSDFSVIVALWKGENYIVYIGDILENKEKREIDITEEEFMRALIGRGHSYKKGDVSIDDFSELGKELVGDYLEKWESTLTNEPLACFPLWECSLNPLICPEYGRQTETCEDVNECGKSYERAITCQPGLCSGCLHDSRCIPYGARFSSEEVIELSTLKEDWITGFATYHEEIEESGPTVPTFTCTPTMVYIGQTVTCSCSSTDPTSEIDSIVYTANPSTAKPGTFVETCTVTDKTGNSKNATVSYVVEQGGSGGGGGGGGGGGPVVTDVEITVELDPETPQAIPGKQIIVKATLRNKGDEEATYTVSVEGNSDWSQLLAIAPQVVTVSIGESEEVRIILSINSDAEGEKDFTIKASSDGRTTTQRVAISLVGRGVRKPQKTNYYCDIDGRIKKQKTIDAEGNWANCQNNYECESNVCSSGECIEVTQMISKYKGFKVLIFKVLCKIAHFIDVEKYRQCIIDTIGEE